MAQTYKQQLADPRWQKRRLTRLELAAWACDRCFTSDKQLHVHHPRYIKGRMAWEYADDELEVLCVDCHQKHHDFDAAVVEASHASPYGYRFIQAMTAGFLEASMDLRLREMADDEVDARDAGRFAFLFFYASGADKRKIAEILSEAPDVRNPVEQEAIEIYRTCRHAE